jgi:hypothetical protein
MRRHIPRKSGVRRATKIEGSGPIGPVLVTPVRGDAHV